MELWSDAVHHAGRCVLLFFIVGQAFVFHWLVHKPVHLRVPPPYTLTGSYPFERPEDRLQPHCKLQHMISRIINVDYIIPSTVSPSAQDLLRELLVADPNARLSIEGVMRHPWFNIGLPAGVLEMNDALLEPNALQVGFCMIFDWCFVCVCVSPLFPHMQSEQEVYSILAAATREPESNPLVHAPYDAMLEQAISHAQHSMDNYDSLQL